MVDAWITGTIVAAAAGVVGFFVVLRGATFAAHALPLAAFPGAAAASLLGVDPNLGLLVAGGLGVVGLTELARRERPEVATALCLVMFLALGALFLSMTRGYGPLVFALLFGELLGIGAGRIAPVAWASGASVLAVALAFRPLLLSSTAPELAEASGLSGRAMEVLFLSVLALATAVALPVVGSLLVFSLLIGPAAAARGFGARPGVALGLSVALSLATVWAAIALSYVTDWPVGFFVGSAGVVLYAVQRGGMSLTRRFAPVARGALQP